MNNPSNCFVKTMNNPSNNHKIICWWSINTFDKQNLPWITLIDNKQNVSFLKTNEGEANEIRS